jgi:hypothetical protein
MEGITAIGASLGRVGACNQGAVVARQRLFVSPKRRQRFAAIVVSIKAIWIYPESAVDLTDSFGILSALSKNHAEQVQGIEMIGLAGEDLPIDLFGVGHPAGLMVRQALCE